MNWKPSFVGGVLAFCYTDCYTDFPQRLGITYFRKAGLATHRGKNEPHTPPPVKAAVETLLFLEGSVFCMVQYSENIPFRR